MIRPMQRDICIVHSFQLGIELLLARLHERESTPTSLESEDEPHALKSKICAGYCGLAELYLTDLCFEDDAEKSCQEALDAAIYHNDADGHEPFQCLASLRLSQGRNQEASDLVMAAYQRICAADAQQPVDFQSRFATSRLLLECAPYSHGCADAALDLLSNMMREDDENIEVWFLMGVGFFQQSPPDTILSREYLNKAGEMLSQIQHSNDAASQGFSVDNQLRLVNEQLALLEKYCEENGEVEEDCVDEGGGAEEPAGETVQYNSAANPGIQMND
jgi:hypothetical protein